MVTLQWTLAMRKPLCGSCQTGHLPSAAAGSPSCLSLGNIHPSSPRIFFSLLFRTSVTACDPAQLLSRCSAVCVLSSSTGSHHTPYGSSSRTRARASQLSTGLTQASGVLRVAHRPSSQQPCSQHTVSPALLPGDTWPEGPPGPPLCHFPTARQACVEGGGVIFQMRWDRVRLILEH